jgi:hypothetical protein
VVLLGLTREKDVISLFSNSEADMLTETCHLIGGMLGSESKMCSTRKWWIEMRMGEKLLRQENATQLRGHIIRYSRTKNQNELCCLVLVSCVGAPTFVLNN